MGGSFDRDLRVLQMIEKLELGGAERHVLDLTAALRDHGHTCDILARPGSIAPDGGFIPVPGTRRFAAWVKPLRAALSSRDYDVLHVHSVAPLVAALFLTRRSMPIVFTVHGWTSRKLRVGRAILRLPWGPNRIIVVSHALAEQFEAASGKVVVVSNGVPDRTNRGHLAQLKSSTIVSVGRLAHPKNQQQLLRAFALVTDQIPDARLDFVGDGPDREALMALAGDLEISHAVRFHGVSDPFPELLTARVFASTSESEGLSLAQLEALMAGLPLVITRSSGADQVVRRDENGSIVGVNDVEGTAEALVKWLSVDGSQAGAVSRTLFEQEFTIDAMVERTVAVYREVVVVC